MAVQDSIIENTLLLNQRQLLQVPSQCLGDEADSLTILYARNLPSQRLELIGALCGSPQPHYLPQQQAHYVNHSGLWWFAQLLHESLKALKVLDINAPWSQVEKLPFPIHPLNLLRNRLSGFIEINHFVCAIQGVRGDNGGNGMSAGDLDQIAWLQFRLSRHVRRLIENLVICRLLTTQCRP